MNLFWETRKLTQAREDHLTCFIAAALKTDVAFAAAYTGLVLPCFALGGKLPRIVDVDTQVSFVYERCRPDMMLMLEDGRRVICEHKVDSPETIQMTMEGDKLQQLERYLALPGIAGLIYFRSAPATVGKEILDHPLYISPQDAPHFQWRDLHAPLASSASPLCQWLKQGFDRLGFTPPVAHIGELWPDESEVVKQNQSNFGKLWQATRGRLSDVYRISAARRCELYLYPLRQALISWAYISPLAQSGSLLRIRLDTSEAALAAVQQRVDTVIEQLPVRPEVKVCQLPNGRAYLELSPLQLLLGTGTSAAEHEARLFAQVQPVLNAVCNDAESHSWSSLKMDVSGLLLDLDDKFEDIVVQTKDFLHNEEHKSHSLAKMRKQHHV